MCDHKPVVKNSGFFMRILLLPDLKPADKTSQTAQIDHLVGKSGNFWLNQLLKRRLEKLSRK